MGTACDTICLEFNGRMVLHPIILTYDLGRFNFPKEIAKVLGVESLEEVQIDEDISLRNRFNDQDTKYHKAYYRSISRIEKLYNQFIKEFVSTVFTESFCFQAIPTFRVHMPNNLAVGEFHSDGDYSHAVGEINFWLPLTPCWNSNSIWIELGIGSGDYRAISAAPGQIVVFDAVRLRHGNLVNDTGVTRFSFDFRCIPLSFYRPREARSVDTGARLVLGDYFSLFTQRPEKGKKAQSAIIVD